MERRRQPSATAKLQILAGTASGQAALWRACSSVRLPFLISSSASLGSGATQLHDVGRPDAEAWGARSYSSPDERKGRCAQCAALAFKMPCRNSDALFCWPKSPSVSARTSAMSRDSPFHLRASSNAFSRILMGGRWPVSSPSRSLQKAAWAGNFFSVSSPPAYCTGAPPPRLARRVPGSAPERRCSMASSTPPPSRKGARSR